ncbi:hypothetical protein CCMSSC00406_0009664 [Pleurotus cornucopiae]|uniref:Uncharacterized protein n=1 Tax=Pleurotus cornucopiae TaxID=5321 RepID=A0ACB7J9L1_PLECO|nr:hypothetical protein CCMSSC00406_0009664 [Pleurotus cornucopiae]
MLDELLGWGSLISNLPYGHAWRIRRRAFWQEFNPARSVNHRPRQLWYSHDLLRLLLKDPDNFLYHIHYSLAASIISSTYGLDVRPENDPNIERAEKALDNFKHAAIAGLYLVDVLPFLKHVPSWMPGAGFKRFAEKSRPDTIDMLNAPFIEGCNRIREGMNEPSLLSRSLAKGGHSIEDHPLHPRALLRDEEYYPDPDTFRPERFLKDGKINPKVADPIPNFVICPGRFFAMDSLWLNIASILTVFDITKAKDKEGRDIEPDIQWTPNFTRHIIPFKCSIKPRSPEAGKLIRDSELI